MQKNLMRMCKIMIIAGISFIILTGFSLGSFSGGSRQNMASLDFNFYENFFSELGAKMTISGKFNTKANILFIIALGILGLSMIYFSNIWKALGTDVHRFKIIGYISNASLIISGISFIGLAFSPYDSSYENNIMFLKLAFGFLLFWTMLILFLQWGNKKIKKLFILNFIYLILLTVYVLILFYGTNFMPDSLDWFETIYQLIIFYTTVVNLIIQSAGIMKFLRSADFRKDGLKNFYV